MAAGSISRPRATRPRDGVRWSEVIGTGVGRDQADDAGIADDDRRRTEAESLWVATDAGHRTAAPVDAGGSPVSGRRRPGRVRPVSSSAQARSPWGDTAIHAWDRRKQASAVAGRDVEQAGAVGRTGHDECGAVRCQRDRPRSRPPDLGGGGVGVGDREMCPFPLGRRHGGSAIRRRPVRAAGIRPWSELERRFRGAVEWQARDSVAVARHAPERANRSRSSTTGRSLLRSPASSGRSRGRRHQPGAPRLLGLPGGPVHPAVRVDGDSWSAQARRSRRPRRTASEQADRPALVLVVGRHDRQPTAVRRERAIEWPFAPGIETAGIRLPRRGGLRRRRFRRRRSRAPGPRRDAGA